MHRAIRDPVSLRPPGFTHGSARLQNPKRSTPVLDLKCRITPAGPGTKILYLAEGDFDDETEDTVNVYKHKIKDQNDLDKLLQSTGVSGLLVPNTGEKVRHFEDIISDGTYSAVSPQAKALGTVQTTQKNIVHANEDAAGRYLQAALADVYGSAPKALERTFKDAKGRVVGEADALLSLGNTIYWLDHKSVMTSSKLLTALKKLKGFIKTARRENIQPFVGKDFVLVLAADLLAQDEVDRDTVLQLCFNSGIPLIVRSGASYMLQPGSASLGKPAFVL
ncbi:hypothetical protein COCSUDRAFT_54492 [Coccomyxa subellipsoidea C-169]|uniref:Uncharacterized protein n=1 Tax=Coccomyxa subellipsoidea (strain C-169) TaxID=574566 RepID=I0YNC0_COCSC|nr:hypothetical protein COCSUDRAFT_54492 [Coccomyxa subellipsoidea C-169]EIE19889.1 hypothetical protein COCSUDRAFT_54492 [Coccomyxa subellipsoidea C-169]|eukprot:XP_005644433.1 hypothetical protein COCSUDRAFT_54492 [Coccomyxa subellipsoidea C-169]